MESLLVFLLIGGLAYFMMRGGGCGAHGHAGHASHNAPHGHDQRPGDQEVSNTGATCPVALMPASDPVCGMRLSPDQGYGKIHQGQAYRFCSRECLDAFEADPQRYVSPEPESDRRRVGHGGCH